MDNTLETLLRYIDSTLGLDRIPLVTWLVLVATVFLALTLISEIPIRRRNKLHVGRDYSRMSVTLGLLLILSSLFTLCAYITSQLTGHYYNIYVILGLVVQLLISCALSLTCNEYERSSRAKFLKKFAVHLNAITVIFIASARWIIRGVDAEETSADTLNIFYNGIFRYSMHAGWYDLAPVDSIIKVTLIRMNGINDPYSPCESFLISFTSGFFLYTLIYIYVKNKQSLEHFAPIIPALLTIHPYASLTGIYITPTNIAIILALATIILFLTRTAWHSSATFLLIASIIFATSTLTHPFSLTVLLFFAVYLVARCIDRSIKGGEILLFMVISLVWLLKTIYTATIHGIHDVFEQVLRGVLTIGERESLIIFRSVGFTQAPRLALASFSASLGILGGIAVTIFLRLYTRRPLDNRWRDFLILLFTGLTGTLSIIAALGGYSRYVFTPLPPLFFLILLFYGEKSASKILKLLIVLATIATMITPNFMPDQYSFWMANKITDRTIFEISKLLFERLDPGFVIQRFQSNIDLRFYIDQKGEFIRSMGEPGLIVDKLMLPGIVKVRSYWDFSNRGPFEALEERQSYSKASIVIDTNLVRVLLLWIGP